MTEPTLAELREMATACATQYPPSHIVRAVGKAFLDLTDPTPLNAEHCPSDWDRDNVFQNVARPDGGIQFDYHGDQRYLTTCEATRGQLRLALMMENNDG